MNKNKQQTKFLAKKRQAEIAKKSQALGALRSGAEKSTISIMYDQNRLIKCDHYMRKGQDLALSNKRDEIKRLKKEIKARLGQEFKHVRKQDGKTIEVTLKTTRLE